MNEIFPQKPIDKNGAPEIKVPTVDNIKYLSSGEKYNHSKENINEQSTHKIPTAPPEINWSNYSDKDKEYFDGIVEFIREGSPDLAAKFLPDIDISLRERAIYEGLTYLLTSNSVDYAIKIKNSFSLNSDLLQRAAYEGLAHNSGDMHWLYHANKIKENFDNSDELIKLDAVQKAAYNALIYNLKMGFIQTVSGILDNFTIQDELFNTDEIKEAAQEGIRYNIKNAWIENADEILKRFPVDKAVIEKAAQEGILIQIKYGEVYRATSLKHRFITDNSFIQSEEVQNAAYDNVIRALTREDIDGALFTKHEFNINDEDMKSAAYIARDNILEVSNKNRAKKIEEFFGL